VQSLTLQDVNVLANSLLKARRAPRIDQASSL